MFIFLVASLKPKRNAISPVLAEIVLIAIVLIAGGVFAGFVFGLFGTFTNAPRFSVPASSCSDDQAGNMTCTILVLDTGNRNGIIDGASFIYADSNLGASTIGGVTKVRGACGNFPCTISAGASISVTLTFFESKGHGSAVIGTAYTGVLFLSSGDVAEFTGSF